MIGVKVLSQLTESIPNKIYVASARIGECLNGLVAADEPRRVYSEPHLAAAASTSQAPATTSGNSEWFSDVLSILIGILAELGDD